MTKLEERLKRALRTESPPAGFAGRVMAEIDAERPRKRRAPWRALAASITLIALLGGWAAHEEAERRRVEGERAREQVLLALQIAGAKVRMAQDGVRSIGSTE